MKHCFIGEHSCYLHNRYMFSSIYLKGRHLSVIFNFIFWALMMRHVFQKEACALLQGNQNWNDWKLLFLKNMDFFFPFSSYFSLCFSSVCSQCTSHCRGSHLQPVHSLAQAEDLRGGLPGPVSEDSGVSDFPVTQFISNSIFSALAAWKWPEEIHYIQEKQKYLVNSLLQI